jgi:predicted lipoprotein with Yx(FWY)xxD motif
VDGKQQVTYKGMPLYTYANDTAPGDTKGDKLAGVWFAAVP